jgi:hypothetical protein
LAGVVGGLPDHRSRDRIGRDFLPNEDDGGGQRESG